MEKVLSVVFPRGATIDGHCKYSDSRHKVFLSKTMLLLLMKLDAFFFQGFAIAHILAPEENTLD